MKARRSENESSSYGTLPIVRLHLLGGFRAFRDEQEIPADLWDRRTAARMLVKVLATSPSRCLHREQMMEVLWPGIDQALGLNRLGKALHAARQVLEPHRPNRMASSYLSLDEEMLSLHRHNVWIDVDEFTVRAQSALATDTMAALQAAFEAYAGELLPGDRYADWASSSRETIAELYLDVLIALARAHERAGNYSGAIARLREVLALDATSEETHRSLMRLYARHGDRNRALRQYQRLTDILQRELGVVPDGTTQTLHAAIKEGKFPPVPVSFDRGTSHFPIAAGKSRSPFTGREVVLRDLGEMLDASIAGSGRVVLLEGIPGIGKSRMLAELNQVASQRGVPVLSSLPPVDIVDGGLSQGASTRQGGTFRYSCGASGEQALLVLLDDLHLADISTLRLLSHAIHKIAARPWLICATYGAGERIDPAFQDLMTVTRQSPAGHVTALQPLTREASGELLQRLLPGAEVPDNLIDRVHTFTLGNPLFMEELVRTMLEGRQLRREAGAWVTYPTTFRIPVRIQTLIAEQVDRLGEDAAAVLALVSLTGTEVPLSFLQRIGYLQQSRLVQALDRAIAAGILEQRGDRYVFPYPPLRVAIASGIAQPRRSRLHALIARTIERYHPDDVEALGYHRGRAGLTVDRLGTFNFAV